jgi:hypothetical protein
MAKRLALLFLALSSPLILVSFFWQHFLSEVLFSLLVVLFPVVLMVVGAARGGRLGPTGAPLWCLALLLVGCGLGMLLLRGHAADGPWLGGLPLAAALQIYGLWLAPLGLVALAYALTFESFALRESDLENLRRMSSASAERQDED